ncbi:MAG: hypothetical protein KKI08_21650 [Armatimonadetes bacterium]|nr:hypothetical protein [Armatimonadota bacterium]
MSDVVRQKAWIGTLVAAVLVVSCTAGLAEGLQVAVGAVGGIAPEGMVGPQLSLRLTTLKGEAGSGAPRALWFDVAATTNDFSEWGLMTGLSADVEAVNKLTIGLADRGGFGRDWTRQVWVLYVSRSFSSLFW